MTTYTYKILLPAFFCSFWFHSLLQAQSFSERRLNYLYDTTAIGKTNRIYQDTIIYNYLRTRIDTTKSRKFTRFIFKTFTSSPPSGEHYHRRPVANNAYAPYKGMLIDSVIIRRNMPYAPENTQGKSVGAFLRKKANDTHVLTKEKIIRNDLLFHPGDLVDPLRIEQSEYLLRNQSGIANVYFVIKETSPGIVNIYVYTIDKLSINVGVDYSGKNANSKAYIGENNFLGLGNQLLVYDHFNFGERNFFKGVEVSHNFSNFLGSFFNLRTNAGIGKNFYLLELESNKNFITSGDYAGGVNYTREKELKVPAYMDTMISVHQQNFNLWGGKSFRLNDKGLNFFTAAKFETRRYFSGPPVNSMQNAYYHNTDDILASVGIYQERFYQANLIYGFGYIEDIPYGFKAEVTGGYRWGQFHNFPYLGGKLSWAFRTHLGYVSTEISSGAFFDKKGDFFDHNSKIQQISHLNLFWFSNLLPLRRNYNLRFFLHGDYMNGHNMLQGEGQRITFSGDYKIRGLSLHDYVGTTRMLLSPEVVLFTPLHVLGFRFAFYGYADLGTLGYRANPFKNPFFGTMGAGVRIRNESLVFRTIQIGFSVLLRNNNHIRGNGFDFRSEKQLGIDRLIPMSPAFPVFE